MKKGFLYLKSLPSQGGIDFIGAIGGVPLVLHLLTMLYIHANYYLHSSYKSQFQILYTIVKQKKALMRIHFCINIEAFCLSAKTQPIDTTAIAFHYIFVFLVLIL